jgi:hypothetical protein
MEEPVISAERRNPKGIQVRLRKRRISRDLGGRGPEPAHGRNPVPAVTLVYDTGFPFL